MDPGQPKQRQPCVDDGDEQEVPMVGSALHQPVTDRGHMWTDSRWPFGGLGTCSPLPAQPCKPILRSIGQGSHQVLLDEEEHGEQEAKAHGTADGR